MSRIENIRTHCRDRLSLISRSLCFNCTDTHVCTCVCTGLRSKIIYSYGSSQKSLKVTLLRCQHAQAGASKVQTGWCGLQTTPGNSEGCGNISRPLPIARSCFTTLQPQAREQGELAGDVEGLEARDLNKVIVRRGGGRGLLAPSPLPSFPAPHLSWGAGASAKAAFSPEDFGPVMSQAGCYGDVR